MAIHEPESLKSVEEKTKTGQIWPDWHQQLKTFGLPIGLKPLGSC